jgi:hypothetical protein
MKERTHYVDGLPVQTRGFDENGISRWTATVFHNERSISSQGETEAEALENLAALTKFATPAPESSDWSPLPYSLRQK